MKLRIEFQIFFSLFSFIHFLGLQAKEIHLCGELSTVKLVEELMITTGDQLEVKEYQRLTKLNYLDRALG